MPKRKNTSEIRAARFARTRSEWVSSVEHHGHGQWEVHWSARATGTGVVSGTEGHTYTSLDEVEALIRKMRGRPSKPPKKAPEGHGDGQAGKGAPGQPGSDDSEGEGQGGATEGEGEGDSEGEGEGEGQVPVPAGGALDELLAAFDKRVNARIEEAAESFGGGGTGNRTFKVERWDGSSDDFEGHAHEKLQEVLDLVAARQPVMLVGPAGCGKSYLARQVADAISARAFSEFSCTAESTVGQLLGRLIPTGEGGRFEFAGTPFLEAYEGGGVALLDEVDAADPNFLLSINGGIAGDSMSIPNRVYDPVAEKHPDFVSLLAANTYGAGADRVYCGRNALDGAFLDRYLVGRVFLDYDRTLEAALVPHDDLRKEFEILRTCISTHKLRQIASTRSLIGSHRMLSAGWDLARILDRITATWSPSEKEHLADVRKAEGSQL